MARKARDFRQPLQYLDQHKSGVDNVSPIPLELVSGWCFRKSERVICVPS